jgi:hypothetical protein
MKESDVRRIVRDEIKRLDSVPRKPRRRLPCGRGSSAPECWGSTIYGPEGCYCK